MEKCSDSAVRAETKFLSWAKTGAPKFARVPRAAGAGDLSNTEKRSPPQAEIFLGGPPTPPKWVYILTPPPHQVPYTPKINFSIILFFLDFYPIDPFKGLEAMVGIARSKVSFVFL